MCSNFPFHFTQNSCREIAKRWLRISTITVKHTEKGSHAYLLSNRTEGEDARANYLRDSARTKITGEACSVQVRPVPSLQRFASVLARKWDPVVRPGTLCSSLLTPTREARARL